MVLWLDSLKELWDDRGFEILCGLALLVLFIIWLTRWGKKGTYDKYIIIDEKKKIKKPPQESSGEKECRKILEETFRKPFVKTRPNMLRNPITENFNMEIDCYNDELKLGVEYNGRQHYEHIPFFHKSIDSFHNQKYRDYIKKDLCSKNGITLIEVPYSVKNIKQFLMEKLRTLGFIK